MVEISNIPGPCQNVRNIEQEGISEARKEAGLTQQELASRLKVTRGTIVRLERGESVSLVVAMNAIRTLGRDVALVPRFSKLQVRP